MSLINDALKKAQNRQGDPTPSPTGTAGPAAIPSAPRKGKTPFAKIVVICAGIAALSAAISAAVIFLVMRRDEPSPAPFSPSPLNKTAVSPVQATATTPTAPPIRAAEPQSSPVTTPITPAADPQTPIFSGQSSASPVTPATVTPTVVVASLPEPAAPAIKLGTRIQAFIDRLRVTSIRISDTGNKAILNDRLFRVNDLVEPSLGLRLTGIEPHQLTFTDETGNLYLRHF